MSTETTPRTHHTLVVELDPSAIEPGHEWHRNSPCDDCNDLPFDLTYECPGTTAGSCESWEECSTCVDTLRDLTGHARDAYIDEVDSEGAAHGEDHMSFSGSPCTRTGKCYVLEAAARSGCDNAWDIARIHGPGRYLIDWDGGDYEDFTVSLIETIE